MRAARLVDQLLGERQAYRGGWPLGFTTATCPAEAPVGCQSSPSYNLNCCPAGQFCFGTLQPYCCPTSPSPLTCPRPSRPSGTLLGPLGYAQHHGLYLLS